MEREGAFLLAANHISHFDPPLISLAARRQIDWMAMVELFSNRAMGAFCTACGAFPTDRSQVDRKAVRMAVARLRQGRCVGIFPEGGIRVGEESLLAGAPVRPGVATLAVMTGVPVVPCVIVGADRLYTPRWWLPWHRVPIWIAFGEPVLGARAEGETREEGRVRVDRELSKALVRLYGELQAVYRLHPEDLPHSSEARGARMF